MQVTGSGKTLAFVIPILEILLRREEKLKKSQVRVADVTYCPSSEISQSGELACFLKFMLESMLGELSPSFTGERTAFQFSQHMSHGLYSPTFFTVLWLLLVI